FRIGPFGGDGSLTVRNWFSGVKIESVMFGDGTVWSLQDIENRIYHPLVMLTDGGDVFNGVDREEIIHAYAGDDIVNAGGGADIVYGGSGNDVIDGGDGDDL